MKYGEIQQKNSLKTIGQARVIIDEHGNFYFC